MKYIVYQTINLVNNYIYIGVHKTENPNVFDGYYGCGVSLSKHYYVEHPKTLFQLAIHTYGFKSFRRSTIRIYDTLQEALDLEAQLVNLDFIKRKDTYNMSLGGGYAKTYYPINQFDKDGTLIYTWENMQEASETLGVSHTSINNAKLYKGSCLGYFWSTEEHINIAEYSYHVGTKTYKYNKEGDLVGEYASITEAAHDVNTKENAIYRAINTQMKHRDFYWSFSLVERFSPKKLNLKGKKLYLYSLEGEYIKELNFGTEVKQFFNISSYSCLKEALMKERPYKNYQLSLEKKDKLSPKETFTDNNAKKVGRYSLQGELLEEFSSIKEATRIYGSGVWRVLNNRQEKTKGFIFKYL